MMQLVDLQSGTTKDIVWWEDSVASHHDCVLTPRRRMVDRLELVKGGRRSLEFRVKTVQWGSSCPDT